MCACVLSTGYPYSHSLLIHYYSKAMGIDPYMTLKAAEAERREEIEAPLVLRWNLGITRNQEVLVEVFEADHNTFEVLLNGEAALFIEAHERKLAFGKKRQYQPSNISRHYYRSLQEAVVGGVKKLQREGNL